MPLEPADRPNIDADDIAGRSFTKVRKGFEANEVRAFLVSVASQVREAQREQADLARRVAELERRATDPQDLDETAVTALLGEETARVLETARTAASEIRAKADDHAAKVFDQAELQATETRDAAAAYDTEARRAADTYAETTRARVTEEVEALRAAVAAEVELAREQSERLLNERTSEAEAAAESIRTEAAAHRDLVRSEADTYAAEARAAADAYRTEVERSADAYRDQARADGDAARADAVAEAERVQAETEAVTRAQRIEIEAQATAAFEVAREQGRVMVSEAQEYRERVIADLADRRRSARTQLDQLAANRDALAVTLTDVTARIESAQRTLADAPMDPDSLGDVATDRAALSAAPPEPHPTPHDGIESPPVVDRGVEDERASGSADSGEEGEPRVTEAGTGTDAVDADADAVEPPSLADDNAEADHNAASVADTLEVGEAVGVVGVETAPETTAEAVGQADAGEPHLSGTAADPADALFARLKAGVDDQGPARFPEETTPLDGAVEPGDGLDGEEVSGPSELAPAEPGGAIDDGDNDNQDDNDPDGEGQVDVELLDRRDAATDELERLLGRRLKRVLADEQNEALDRLRRIGGQASAAEVLVDEVDHLARYRDAAAEELRSAERAGAAFYGPAPERTAEVDDVAEQFATELVRALRGRLEHVFDDGGDEADIAERIRACYREWKTQRIAQVASHYVLVAFGRGLAESTSDDKSRWLVDHGGEPAPDCEDNALAGALPAGERFPTGDAHPPAHPGCRCLAVPER